MGFAAIFFEASRTETTGSGERQVRVRARGPGVFALQERPCAVLVDRDAGRKIAFDQGKRCRNHLLTLGLHQNERVEWKDFLMRFF